MGIVLKWAEYELIGSVSDHNSGHFMNFHRNGAAIEANYQYGGGTLLKQERRLNHLLRLMIGVPEKGSS